MSEAALQLEPAEPLVCACLAWYREPPESLQRCVSSLAGVAGVLVALDGRWDLMPGDTDTSDKVERDAITEAASEAGVKLILTGKGAPFESQITKRTELLRLGIRTGAPWLFVIDGDESIECPDPVAFRAALGRVECDVAMVNLHTCGRLAKQIDRGVRRIYRAATRPVVERAHNGYRTEDGRWLHGDSLYAELEPAAVELEPLLTLEHHTDARRKSRQKEAATYRIARRRERLERWRY